MEEGMLKKCLFIIGSIAALYGMHNAPSTALPHESFYFMRHGQTDWNRDNRCMGQIDIPINEDGKAQARQAALVLKNRSIAIIVSSPLQRAVQTAAIIAQQLNKPLVIVEDLKECNFGEQQGQPDGDWFTAWKAGTPINGAETFTQFQERVVQGAHIALRLGQCVLIVAHGAVYI